MSDPITTVVTVISEHPQAVAAVASIYGVAKPFLEKILGPSADELGEIGRDYIKGRRAKNTERTLTDADKMLAAVGREPQEVPLAVVVPLLEAASLQDEPSLAEKWAALLANAADPAQPAPVQPAFADMLRQLAPADIRILQALYLHQGQAPQPTANRMLRKELAKLLSLPIDEVELATENLQRLGLSVDAILKEADVAAGGMDGGVVATNLLGLAFMRAVSPPTP